MEIAQFAGITYHEPPTKEEVAEFETYLLRLTENPITVSPEQIMDTPTINTVLSEVNNNIVVSNLNLNLAETAEPLSKIEDFIHYADVIRAVFLSAHDLSAKENEILQTVFSSTMEVDIIAFRPTQEKYMTSISKLEAKKIFDKEFYASTIIVNGDEYDVVSKKMKVSHEIRSADLVVFGSDSDLNNVLQTFFERYPEKKVKFVHIGTTEGDPIQMLVMQLEDHHPYFVMNFFGNVKIKGILEKFNNHLVPLDYENLRLRKDHLNDLFAIWLNNWDVDWVETMLDGQEMHMRSLD
jgi:hypothetical protein